MVSIHYTCEKTNLTPHLPILLQFFLLLCCSSFFIFFFLLALGSLVIIYCLFASTLSSRSLRNRAEAPSEALPELQHESQTSPFLGGEGDGSSGDDPLSACQLGKYKSYLMKWQCYPSAVQSHTHTCTIASIHPYPISFHGAGLKVTVTRNKIWWHHWCIPLSFLCLSIPLQNEKNEEMTTNVFMNLV